MSASGTTASTSRSTGYSKSTTNALVAVNLAPSVGGFTVGTCCRNRRRGSRIWGRSTTAGMEMSLTANLISGRNTRLDLTVNQSYNGNKVITLGPGIAPILFNSGNNGNAQVHPGGATRSVRGTSPATPTTRTTTGSSTPYEVHGRADSVLPGQSRPGAVVQHQPAAHGASSTSRSRRLFDRQSDFLDFNFGADVPLRRTFENCQWDYDPHTTLQNQAKVAAAFAGTGSRDISRMGRSGSGASCRCAPRRPTAGCVASHVSALSFTIAGRNLRTWTKYTGVDPEINSTPTVNAAQLSRSSSRRAWSATGPAASTSPSDHASHASI